MNVKLKQEEVDREYCRKMASNITGTTKGNIIKIVSDAAKNLHDNLNFSEVRILDVGCADGSFTLALSNQLPDYVKITGLEPNYDRFTRANELSNDRLDFMNDAFTCFFVEDFMIRHGLADIVLFSSVMHEISSDGNNGYDYRYSPIPIVSALKNANDLMTHEGYVVVRDFIKSPLSETRYVTVEFTNQSIQNDLKAFLSIRRAPLLGQMSNLRRPLTIREDILMEFLMCETWGKANWDREVLEKKLIMEPSQWTQAFNDTHFVVEDAWTSKEEYPEYFSKLVKITDPEKFVWPDFTFIKVGRKQCLV